MIQGRPQWPHDLKHSPGVDPRVHAGSPPIHGGQGRGLVLPSTDRTEEKPLWTGLHNQGVMAGHGIVFFRLLALLSWSSWTDLIFLRRPRNLRILQDGSQFFHFPRAHYGISDNKDTAGCNQYVPSRVMVAGSRLPPVVRVHLCPVFILLAARSQ